MSEDEHVCDACGRRRATVHLTDLVDGRAVERHLCKQCYEETEGASLPRERTRASATRHRPSRSESTS